MVSEKLVLWEFGTCALRFEPCEGRILRMAEPLIGIVGERGTRTVGRAHMLRVMRMPALSASRLLRLPAVRLEEAREDMTA